MFRVIAVDDEPAALAHICSIIEKRCPDYKIIGTAENGKEGLKLVRKLHPDVVISDVKMPLMNGIELVTTVKEELPDVYSIIVSGYQDFEYARGAIRSGVFDYILKPVMPGNVQKVMDKLAAGLKMDHCQARNEIIRKLCSGTQCQPEEIARFFPYEHYYGAIIRKNGLPRRFSNTGNMEIYSDVNELMTVYGRDEMESLYIIPKELLMGRSFHEYIFEVWKKSEVEEQYSTMVYARRSFSVEEMQQRVSKLYRALDMVSVVGYSQTVELQSADAAKEIRFDHDEINQVLGKLEYMLKEQQIEKLKKELHRLYNIWKDERKPQLWLEYVFRQILYIMRKYSKDSTSLIECEYMMEDAFFYAVSADMLIENLFDIMFHYIKENRHTAKVDSPEFFASIREYLEEHLAENLTLQDVCRRFGVSQTYLSKLFRKYVALSFNRYLTELRMDKAIDLLGDNQSFFIKDVAAMVGYPDQFYFSRIFRSYTGKCPTEFVDEL